MYKNYGDKNFFEYGMLVDADTDRSEYWIIACLPYDDEEDRYLFGDCCVDITEPWIDREKVMEYIGLSEETFDPVEFAIGCMSYYGWDNFGADRTFQYNWLNMTKARIKEILMYRDIDKENVCLD